jgi:hypothetical protein
VIFSIPTTSTLYIEFLIYCYFVLVFVYVCDGFYPMNIWKALMNIVKDQDLDSWILKP